MKKITNKELEVFLRKHKLWLIGDPKGERANLTRANLTGADLTGANLYGADLYGVNLTRANLYGANLYGANLTGADLTGANLTRANLYGANLTGADLTGANLTRANLTRANLTGAYLTGADLTGANLKDATNVNYPPIACPEKGSFIGFKKASGYIVELEITEDAMRCSASSRKCRCSKARVISITDLNGTLVDVESVRSSHDPNFIYTVGKIVEVKDFDPNRWNECSTGIHFFITRQEAVNY